MAFDAVMVFTQASKDGIQPKGESLILKDGITLAAELRQLARPMGIAVISANQQVEVVKRAQAAGATFLPKPLTEKALAGFFAAVAEQRNAAGK